MALSFSLIFAQDTSMAKTNIFEDIHVMYNKFRFPIPRVPTMLPTEIMKDRLEFLDEELYETYKAHDEEDMEEIIDGLIDLIVVAAGTLVLMGVDGQSHWREVLRANMSKEVGEKPGRIMKYDLRKPDGWIPPNHEKILKGSK